MSESTLFEAATPLLNLLSLYGLQTSKYQRSGCIRRFLSLAIRSLILFFAIAFILNGIRLSFVTFFDILSKERDHCGNLPIFVDCDDTSIGVFLIYIYVRHYEKQLATVIEQLKSQLISTKAQRTVKNGVNMILFFIIVFELLVALKILVDLSLYVAAGSFLPIVINVPLEPILIFPTVICSLIYVVAVYCPARLDEKIEEMKSTRSPIRKAKMTTAVIKEFYRLRSLAIETNRLLSPIIHLMKHMAVAFTFFKILWMLTGRFDAGLVGSSIMRMGLALQSLIFIVFYLNCAAAANNMKHKVLRMICHQLLEEDALHSCHPYYASPDFLKMRLEQLIHCINIGMDRGCFTLGSDPIEDDLLYTILIEISDMLNLSIGKMC